MKSKIYSLITLALTFFSLTNAFGQAELQLRDVSISPTAIEEGDAFKASFKVINTGTSTSGASNVGVYISDDNQLDKSLDTQLSDLFLNELPSSGDASFTDINIAVPAGYTDRIYYVFIVVDANETVSEVRETNNTHGPVKLLISSKELSYDLSVKNTSVSSSRGYKGESMEFSTDLFNLGADNISNATLRVVLSENSTMTGDNSVRYETSTSIGANSRVQFEDITITIPQSWAHPTGYLFFIADPNNELKEHSEGNNQAYLRIQVASRPKAELSIRSFTTDNNRVELEESFPSTVEIMNSGEGKAQNFYLSYYLDNDNNFDNGYVRNFADEYIASLPSGALQTINFSPNVYNVSSGSYYVHVKVDGDSDVEEINEGNNVKTLNSTIEVSPRNLDLIVENATLNGTTFKVGQEVTMQARVRNIGTRSVDYSYLGYYLSEDAAWDNSDIYLSQDYVNSLEAGSYNDENFTYIISGEHTGNYYILFVADRHRYRAETNESNNVTAVPITIRDAHLDLKILSVDFSPELVLDSYNNFDISFTNSGSDDLEGSVSIRFYASPDGFSGNDRDLAYYTQYGIDAGETINWDDLSFYVNSSGLTAGQRYILYAKIDYNNTYIETNERNNVFQIGKVTTRPSDVDITITDVSLSYTRGIALNASNTLYFDVHNAGIDRIESTYSGVYLSTDNILNESSDIQLNTRYQGALDGGQSGTNSTSINLNSATYEPGTYYLFIVADVYKRRTETNEANNVYSFGEVELFLPDYDLEITSAAISGDPDWIIDGGSIQVNYSITNNSALDEIGSSSTGFYLSTDASFDMNDDSYLTNDGVSALAPGGVSNEARTISESSFDDFAPGTYYLFLVADRNSIYTETNESNNVYAFGAVTIRNRDFDLEITSASIAGDPDPDWIIDGGNIQVNYSITNNAILDEIGYSYTGFYLSSDDQLDTEDKLLASQYASSLAPGDSLNQTRTIYESYFDDVAPGTYYLFLKADVYNYHSEANEANNAYLYGTVTVRYPDNDLEITSASSSDTEWLIGSNGNNISYTVQNNGSDAISSSSIGIYASTDSSFNKQADSLLVNLYVGAMDSSGTYSSTANFGTSASSITPGTYYIFLEADFNEQRIETDEANNVISIGQMTLRYPDFDLEIIEATGPAGDLLIGNTNGSVSYEITNHGVTDLVNGSHTGIYLSSNAIFEASDTNISDNYVSALSPGDTTSGSLTIYISDATAPGDYYLILFADRYENFNESNENNNTYVLGPYNARKSDNDLAIASASIANTDWASGAYASVGFELINNSSSDSARNFYNRIYLSTDSLYDNTDQSISSSYYSEYIGPGDTVSFSPTPYIPAGTAAGTYYVFVVADATDRADEADETNNTFLVGTVTVRDPDYDLEITSVSIPGNPDWIIGENTSAIEYSITNNGTLDAISSSSTEFYLSTDASFNVNDDNYLTNDGVIALAPGDTSNETRYISESYLNDVAPGTYYLFLVADRTNNYLETNESNNVYSFGTVVVRYADYDLRVVTASTPDTAWVKGATVQVDFGVTNTGTIDTIPSTYTRIYLSTDELIDDSDITLITRYTGQTNPGDTVSVNQPFTLSSGIADGAYYVLLRTDISNYWVETDETNNDYSFGLVTVAASGGGLRTINSGSGNATDLFYLYPNPSSRSITLANQSELIGASFAVFDQTGKTVLSGLLDEHPVDIEALRSGIYIMRVSADDRKLDLRFIKK